MRMTSDRPEQATPKTRLFHTQTRLPVGGEGGVCGWMDFGGDKETSTYFDLGIFLLYNSHSTYHNRRRSSRDRPRKTFHQHF